MAQSQPQPPMTKFKRDGVGGWVSLLRTIGPINQLVIWGGTAAAQIGKHTCGPSGLADNSAMINWKKRRRKEGEKERKMGAGRERGRD